MVAEAIALRLRCATYDIYLGAKIFTGLMFLKVLLCMPDLKIWKLGHVDSKEEAARHEGDGHETGSTQGPINRHTDTSGAYQP